MTRNAWIIFGVVVVALFGGLIYLSAKNNIDVSKVDLNSILPATKQSGDIADHVFGNKNAKVQLVQYGDFQCPGCGSAHPIIKAVTEKYKNDMSFVFRNFPLTTIHPNARAAAAAAEAAGLMGKYWEMHNALYDNQDSWVSASITDRNTLFENYATQIGLNGTKFENTLADKTDQINQKISFDQALGKKANVTGTPTFVLNGKMITQQVKDGKLVPAGTSGATEVWADQSSFDSLIIQPALKEAGVKLPATK